MDLQLRAAPGSLCAVRAVDESVLLLRPESELSNSSVSGLLTWQGSTEKIDWLHQDKRWIPGSRKESLRETVPHTRGRQSWCGHEGRNDDMGNSWKSSV